MDLDQTQVVVVEDLDDDDLTYDLLFGGEKKPAANLRLLAQNDLYGTSYPLYEGDNVIGRNGGTCHVTILSQSLSKEHACIQIIDDSHLIFDKGSSNKTRRGKLVLRPDVRYELRHGDVITFADIKCVYEIIEQPHSSRAGVVTDFQSTLVLSESDSDNDDVQVSQRGVIQETLVVEDSDEDSPEDLLEMATQPYDGAGVVKDQQRKAGKSYVARQKGAEYSQQPTMWRNGTRSFEVAGSSGLKRGTLPFEEAETTSIHKKLPSSALNPREVVDEDSDEVIDDDVELFAVSTLAYDVSTDVVHVDDDDDDDDIDKGSASDVEVVTKEDATVEVVTKEDEAASSDTVATAYLDATVAVGGRGKGGNKRALAKRGINNNVSASTQMVDATVVVDEDDSMNRLNKMRNTRGRKGMSDHTDDATAVIADTVPTSSIPPTRGRPRGLQLQKKARQARDSTSKEPALSTHGESSDKSQSIEKCEKTGSRSKQRLRRDPYGGNNDQSHKPGKTLLESTQILCPGDGDSTQPYEADGSLGMLAACAETQQLLQNTGDTQVVGGRDEAGEGSQGGAASVRARLSSLPQASPISSDDSDLDERSVLWSHGAHLDDESQSDADLVEDQEPTLAYDLAVEREPTLAYDLAVEREHTLAYDLAVEEKPKKQVQKRRLSKSRRCSRNKADVENPCQDTSVTVPQAPPRSPLKSALVDRGRSPSPAHRHVVFAEATDVDRQVEEGTSMKTPRCLPSQVPDTDAIAGSSARLRQTRNQKVLPQPASPTQTESNKSREGDGLSTVSKKRRVVSELETNGSNLGKRNNLDMNDQETSPKAATRDIVVCEAGDDVSLIPGPACHTEETTASKAVIKRRTAAIKDPQEQGGITDVDGSLKPTFTRGRMSVGGTGQVVAMTNSRGRRKQVSDKQHTSAGKKETRRSAVLPVNKKKTDEAISINALMGDGSIKVVEKENTGSVTEVAFSRTAKEISKEDLEEGTDDSNGLTCLNLHGKDTKTGRRKGHQEGSSSVARKNQALTGSTRQGHGEEGITELQVPAKVKTRGAAQPALAEPENPVKTRGAKQPTLAEPENPVKKVAARTRKVARGEGSDSHLGKSDSSGEKIGCEVTSSVETPPVRVAKKGVKKSKLTEETAEDGQHYSQSRLEPEASNSGHSIEPARTGRGKKRKTSTPRSEEETIAEGSNASGGHRPDQSDRKAAPKLAHQSPSHSALNQSAVLASSSNTSTASSSRSRASTSRTSTTSAAGHQSVRAGGRKTQATESGQIEADSEKTGNGQISAQLPSKRRKTDTATNQENVLLGPNSPVKSMTQSPYPSKRSKQTPNPRAGTSQADGLGKLSTSLVPRVMLTGYVDKQADKIVKDLGGEMATSIEECTHLVTDRICRTVKLLSGLAKGLLIVSHQWLPSCKEAGSFLDGQMFLVADAAMEEQYKFDLATSIRRAQDSPLLAGYRVHVTASVRPDPAQMKDILTFAGAEYLKTIPKKPQGNTVVISCLDDHVLCQPAIKAGIPVVGAEFILTGILRQEVDLESYCLFKEGSSSHVAGKGRTRKK